MAEPPTILPASHRDHPLLMSASSVDKPAKEHRKPEDPSLEVDGQEAEGEKPRKSKTAKVDKASASTSAAAEAIESSAEPAREKLRKKRKKTNREDVLEDPQGIEDLQPEKKKKKRRHEERKGTEQADGSQIGDSDSGRKKKKKRKELATTGDGEQECRKEGESGEEAVSNHGVQPSSSKKEKKEKKKRKQSADEEAKERPKERSKKKRKHSSSSGFPNPSEDESLSEQGRKGAFRPSHSWSKLRSQMRSSGVCFRAVREP